MIDAMPICHRAAVAFTMLGTMRKCGVGCHLYLAGLIGVIIRHSGIPSLKGWAERSIQGSGSGLHEQMRSCSGPLHLLLLGETLADHGVDGRFRKG